MAPFSVRNLVRCYVGFLCAAWFTTAAAQTRAPRDIMAEISSRADLAKARSALIKQATIEAARPVIHRPATFQELMAEPQASMKYDEKPSHQDNLTEAQWHRFALALGDSNINQDLAARLPRIAAAYRLNGDEKLLRFLRSQLAEMTQWSPLQRPGAIAPGQNISPAPWLGTGWGIRAISETLDLLGEQEIPAELRQKFTALFDQEIAEIREAWAAKRLWYTRDTSAFSNQWVVPMEGLVRASIFNGVDKHRDDYEFGVANLLRSMDAQGPQGEFVEGVGYSGITMNALLSAAEASARIGDNRLIQHPYLKKFPIWYAHHLQPGGKIINAFDSQIGQLDPALLSRFVAVTHSPEALWAMRHGKKEMFGNTLWGLLGQAAANYPPVEPPLFAVYDVAARINWRDSWDDDTAAGFWMRGGHRTDAHDHMDRGHISYAIGQRQILIEAGLFSYGIPTHPTHFRSVAGHNVLQVGSTNPDQLTPAVLKQEGQIQDAAHRAAPITVAHMDKTGGAASVDASGCYAAVRRWVRHVTWNRDGVDVRDEVELKSPEIITFRWHLGAAAPAQQTIAGNHVNIEGIDVSFDADAPLSSTVEAMPGFNSDTKKVTNHACVVIRSAAPVKSLTLNSHVKLTK